MKIVVCIKQVPETSNVTMDPETGTMVRTGVESVVNPLDLYAIEAALRLRERFGGSVTAITMGPPPAERAVREAISMGCDDGALLSDRRFAGSDTWSTSYTLAAAIRAMGSVDLVMTGERATDGDTAQVGPEIAAWMDLPLATYVARLRELDTEPRPDPDAAEALHGRVDTLTVERLVEEGYQIVRVPLPALVTVVKEVAAVRLPTLRGKRKARAAAVPTLGADDLPVDADKLGLRGSPTKVVKISTPKVARTGVVFDASDGENVPDAVDRLIGFLRERNAISPLGGIGARGADGRGA